MTTDKPFDQAAYDAHLAKYPGDYMGANLEGMGTHIPIIEIDATDKDKH